jgi:hypothetical protein
MKLKKICEYDDLSKNGYKFLGRGVNEGEFWLGSRGKVIVIWDGESAHITMKSHSIFINDNILIKRGARDEVFNARG